MYVLLLVERNSGRDVSGSECGVTAADDVFQVCGGNLRGRDVEGEDFVCEVFEGKVFPTRCPVVRQCGDFFWDEQASI
jgi:hypothetical protein